MKIVTLVYLIDVGVQNPLAFGSRVQAVKFDQGALAMLGMDFIGFNFGVAAGKIEWTIRLKTNALGDTLWQDDAALKYATRNLFQDSYALQLPALVTAEEPVVS